MSRRPPRTLAIDTEVAGFWRVIVYPKRAGYAHSIDLSMLRGMPVQLQRFGHKDPFGPDTATLFLPQVSYFDRLGSGDLWWLRPYADVELRWVGPLPAGYGYGRIATTWHPTVKLPHIPVSAATTPAFSWWGRIEPFSYTDDGLTLTLKGTMLTGDDILAKPEYPHSPLPYEWAMAKKMLNHPSLGMKHLRVLWPQWWTRVYGPPPKGTPSYLIPQGISAHQFWSALVTRQTGAWDPLVTSYFMTLLSAMYTERGRWTLDLTTNREPVLIHRDMIDTPNASTVVVDVTDPDNLLSFDTDWSQAIGAVFGQGTSLAGNVYSGMHVTPDGMLTSYEPLAALRQVHPESNKNEWLDLGRARKEVLLQMQAGLTELEARGVAEAHLRRFGDPGETGTVTVSSDPTIGGVSVPKHLVRAGMPLQLPNVGGVTRGLLAHITETSSDLVKDVATYTFDTKWRDALTVAEVRMRGRDALAVQRQLVVGVYSPPIDDQLIPWDYARGSGYFPSGPALSAQRLFDHMPADLDFPWESWTVAHPPSNPRWRKCYVKVGKASKVATNNWAYVGSPKAGRLGVPVRLAQAGQIRLVQIAAYDAAGHVLRVPFHISLFSFHGVGVNSMPEIPHGQRYGRFGAHQRYPFGRNAWEAYTETGTLTDPNIPQPATTSGLIRGWGDFYEKAGYSPGSSGRGNPATGLLVDEAVWHFDLTQAANQFSPYTTKQIGPYRGQAFAMVYCDAQGTQPVYLMGRMFRVEPGATS